MCNVPHSAVTGTRILPDISDIQLLHCALKTQNMACVHMRYRGMINSLSSVVQQSTFTVVFFWRAASLASQNKDPQDCIAGWWTVLTLMLFVFLERILPSKVSN